MYAFTSNLRANKHLLVALGLSGLQLCFTSLISAQPQQSSTDPSAQVATLESHTAMLMAIAEVLTGIKSDIPGTVMFISQPSEEGSSIVDHRHHYPRCSHQILIEGSRIYATFK